MFSKKDIERYYDLSEVHYRLFWNLDQSKSLHYGYWDSTTKNFHEALLNINHIMSSRVTISKTDRVLDAGCGVGGSSVWLAREIGCSVTGISLSAKQVKQATALAFSEKLDHQVEFELKDYTSTGFPDASFDVVWAIESVCYAKNKAEFLNEAFRILKKGGRLIVADFFKNDQLDEPDAKLVERWANGWAIDDYATKEAFVQQSSDAGFINISAEDASEPIMPSAKKLYRAYFLGIIPAFFYRLFNRNHTALAKNNVDTAYLQYKTLKKGLWRYLIVSAYKK